jgi:hypothetical protein
VSPSAVAATSTTWGAVICCRGHLHCVSSPRRPHHVALNNACCKCMFQMFQRYVASVPYGHVLLTLARVVRPGLCRFAPCAVVDQWR